MPKKEEKKENTPIPADSHYFNTETGEKLPENRVSEPSNITPVAHKIEFESIIENIFKKSEEKESPNKPDIHLLKKDNSKMIAMLSLVVIVGSLSFITLYFYTNFFTKPSIEPAAINRNLQQSKNLNIVELDVGLATGEFNSQQLVGSVPDNASIYMEFNDLASFLDKYVLENNFSASNKQSAKNLLKQDFAFFSMPVSTEHAWAFILLPKDIGVLKEVLNDVEHPEWHFRLIGDVLVVANNREVFTHVDETKRGVEANLAQTTEYTRARTRLGNSGQALVIFSAQDASRNLLSSIKDKNIHPDLLAIINSILETELYELIIRKQDV